VVIAGGSGAVGKVCLRNKFTYLPGTCKTTGGK